MGNVVIYGKPVPGFFLCTLYPWRKMYFAKGNNMNTSGKEDIKNITERIRKSLKIGVEEDGKQDGGARKFTKDDRSFVLAMLGLAFLFSVRGGEMPGAVVATLRQVFMAVFYGFGTVFLIIGVTKKMFKYNPDRVQIVRWAVGLAVFFAVSQFIHEGFLLYTGQMPLKP